MAKLTQRQLALLRAEYLQKREEILKSRVNSLSVKLWDKIFESYLAILQQENGNLIKSEQNINLVNGLDEVYKNFNRQDNIPLIRKVVEDWKGVIPLNERYFKNIAQKNVSATAEVAYNVVDRRLGLDESGNPKPNGFVDKFINDKSLLRSIKRSTIKALTQGKSFTDFRQELKIKIQGDPNVPNSGGLHQYYRNYAYDTYQKVDRVSGEAFAKELGLRYFFWQGGLIQTSRPICVLCNGMLIDSYEFKDLTYSDLKESLRDGLDESWKPMQDLGQYGCRHSIDWVSNSIAERYSGKIISMSRLTN